MMMERLAAPNGPTKGKILRPPTTRPGKRRLCPVRRFRDENHLPYCSYICCMASLKQATYVREQYPDAKIYIFYIDLRAPGQRYEKFYKKIKEDETSFSSKARSPRSAKIGDTKCVTVVAENAVTGEKSIRRSDGGPGHRHAAHSGQRQTSGGSEVHGRRLHHQ
jgi:quinone-modifying oxidoreductase subunit QmoA